jgi:hypothetical protein
VAETRGTLDFGAGVSSVAPCCPSLTQRLQGSATPTSVRVKVSRSSSRPGKLQHRVPRARVTGSKLLEFGRLPRPLWIRRVLVRAWEGQ